MMRIGSPLRSKTTVAGCRRSFAWGKGAARSIRKKSTTMAVRQPATFFITEPERFEVRGANDEVRRGSFLPSSFEPRTSNLAPLVLIVPPPCEFRISNFICSNPQEVRGANDEEDGLDFFLLHSHLEPRTS